jgi:arsenical pump membrane protein
VQEVAAYSTVFMTLSLVVTRPRLGPALRLSPAVAALVGVAIMAALGVVGFEQLSGALTDLWSPFVAIASIMVMTEVATRVGLLDWGAAQVEARAHTTARMFALVFALGVVTATALNNDAAILLLTPLVVALVRRRYPDRPELVVPFAFAVFIAAGVAALPVSNPMNMVVAEFSGIGFNDYALHMAPIAVAGWVVGFLVLRRWFRRELTGAPATAAEKPQRSTTAQRRMMVLLLSVLAAYSIVGYFGGPVWIVALGGATASLALARRHGNHSAVILIRYGVSWETLVFLLAVLVLALGLLEVGLVDRLVGFYDGASVGGVGFASAFGSAVLNNHPMAYLNMLALEGAGHGDAGVFAALIGGDLGPRLLPMGSLAGLLWLEMLRRQGVEIRLRQFMTVGAIVTVPTLVVSLLLLAAF